MCAHVGHVVAHINDLSSLLCVLEALNHSPDVTPPRSVEDTHAVGLLRDFAKAGKHWLARAIKVAPNDKHDRAPHQDVLAGEFPESA